MEENPRRSQERQPGAGADAQSLRELVEERNGRVLQIDGSQVVAECRRSDVRAEGEDPDGQHSTHRLRLLIDP